MVAYKASFEEDSPDANRKTAKAIVASYVEEDAPLEVLIVPFYERRNRCICWRSQQCSRLHDHVSVLNPKCLRNAAELVSGVGIQRENLTTCLLFHC